jgi:putative hemolysin
MSPAAHPSPFPWFDVALILVLVALNGVFAMSELAIVSSRDARLRAMAKTGRKGAQTALDLASDPGRVVWALPIGLTRIGLFGGAN